jgi:hypothetical protein
MERLKDLAALVDEGYETVKETAPGAGMGYTVFLGCSYAASPRGIMMLGLNPGVSSNENRNATLQESNWLLEGAPQKRLPYWMNARRLFSHHGLAQSLADATFSFCCPYRTPTWVDLPATTRQALVRASKQPLQRMIEDCDPRLIIVAGIAGEAVFRETLGSELTVSQPVSTGPYAGTYRWRASSCFLGDHTFTLAQIPHLSRANSKAKLQECAQWLADMVAHD